MNETCSNVVLSGVNAGREYAKIFPERFGIRAPRFGGRKSAAVSCRRGFEAGLGVSPKVCAPSFAHFARASKFPPALFRAQPRLRAGASRAPGKLKGDASANSPAFPPLEHFARAERKPNYAGQILSKRKTTDTI